MKCIVLIKYFATVYVEADNEEQAIELAREEADYTTAAHLEFEESSIAEVLDGKTDYEIERARKSANCESLP